MTGEKKADAASNTYRKKSDMKKEREKRSMTENPACGERGLTSWELLDLRLRFDLPFYIETCKHGMKPFAYENAYSRVVHDVGT